MISNTKPDKIIFSQRKSIAFIITGNAEFIVRAPKRTSIDRINDLIVKRSKWINETITSIKEQIIIHSKRSFSDGENFLFLGKNFILSRRTKINKPEFSEDKLIIPDFEDYNARKELIKFYKIEFEKILNERIQRFTFSNELKYQKIKITNAKKRWGSCSYKNNLCFSWRLAMTPLEVIDYVVVHELCHTIVKNHSKDFWELVANIIPDHKTRSKWLKDNSKILDLF
jgi:predicted metal-dependent hydrolase